MTKKVFIEFDALDLLLHNVKSAATNHYHSKEVTEILNSVFEEIDRLLIMYEENYKLSPLKINDD